MLIKKSSRLPARSPVATPSPPSGRGMSPADLVGLSFRDWMLGFAAQDLRHWENGWCRLSSELDVSAARAIASEIEPWVRSIAASTNRAIAIGPVGCATLCPDECLAVAMVAACQFQVCPAIEACAMALTGQGHVAETIQCATSLGLVLRASGQVLSTDALGRVAPRSTKAMLICPRKLPAWLH